MGGTQYIDVLRMTRDHGLSLTASLLARNESIEVCCIAPLEKATGDDIIWILSSAAMQRDVLTVITHFTRESDKDAEAYFCFLYDEMERNGFDAEYVTYDDEDKYVLCIPLFTCQDDVELYIDEVVVEVHG